MLPLFFDLHRWRGPHMEAKRHDSLLKSMVYPAVGRADEWLVAEEIKIFPARDLLLCSVPGAGAEPLEAVLAGTPEPPVPVDIGNATQYRAAFSLERQQVRKRGRKSWRSEPCLTGR